MCLVRISCQPNDLLVVSTHPLVKFMENPDDTYIMKLHVTRKTDGIRLFY